ncbi:sterile alpha motif domain-containing protein 9 [Paralichthys olivaceus]|uniref:sterile alpha motif domain-containing protein 9 n=1 Tax=Paralichthys olivaceus TaxID=8255 RepID=UPI003751907B
MDRRSPDSQSSHTSDESSADGSEVSVEDMLDYLYEVQQYVNKNPDATNTKLFCMVGLLNLYVPESYLLMAECQRILGPPDPIHGGPPFEKRMEPFTRFFRISNGKVCMVHQGFACVAVEIIAKDISRSDTVKKMMVSLCGAEVQPHVLLFIKDLLTKREMGEKGKEKFSRLVEDILKHENFTRAFSVLRTASNKFRQNSIFPQVVSRLNYLGRRPPDYEEAEHWAKIAIARAPDNSYIADTLGQVYKNILLRDSKTNGKIMEMAVKAFRAFEDVERKADREEQPQMDTEGSTPTSELFNNRGLFGFLQVAKIAFEKKQLSDQQRRSLIKNNKMKVEAKFEFFEWYLTYSMPDETPEPNYFWKDVALCYEHYTTNNAAESTSFPGLLYCLNLGLFTSRGNRARFQEEKKSGADLEEIQEVLKNTYEENVDDVPVAERYILSNIILSNRMPDSPQLTSVEELRKIILRFLDTERRRRSPEFYLLVLLLLWPGEQPPVVQDKEDEEEKQPSTDHDDCSGDRSREEEETRGESEQLPLDLICGPQLQKYVTFMEKAYERTKYAKYLRSRHLLPLFFLGKGSGLSKWIHKSRLDGIVENTVDTELAGEGHPPNLEKESRINEMWMTGEVWQVPEIQNILLPVRVEHNEGGVFVWARGRKIKVSTEVESGDSRWSSMRFYLGLNIKGPVVLTSLE